MGSDVSYLDTLQSDAAALATAARAAGLGAAVPSCPDWDVQALVRHTGRVFTSCAAVVRERGPVDFGNLPTMPKGDGVVEAFEERAAALVSALADLPEDLAVWNWFGIEPPIPGFYHRRMANEVAIHRWDAQAAAGTTAPIDTALAVDGIAEFMTLMVPNQDAETKIGGSLHVHATDADAEWVIRQGAKGLDAAPEHAKADAAVRGTASDLNLFLVNRVPPSALDVVGDAAVAENWGVSVKF